MTITPKRETGGKGREEIERVVANNLQLRAQLLAARERVSVLEQERRRWEGEWKEREAELKFLCGQYKQEAVQAKERAEREGKRVEQRLRKLGVFADGSKATSKLQDLQGRALDMARRIDMPNPLEAKSVAFWEKETHPQTDQPDPYYVDIVRLCEERTKMLREEVERREVELGEMGAQVEFMRTALSLNDLGMGEKMRQEKATVEEKEEMSKWEEQMRYFQSRVESLERAVKEAENERDEVLRGLGEGGDELRETLSKSTQRLQKELTGTQRERDKLALALRKFEDQIRDLEGLLVGLRAERDNFRGLYEQAYTELRSVGGSSVGGGGGADGTGIGRGSGKFQRREDTPSAYSGEGMNGGSSEARTMGQALSAAQMKIVELERRLRAQERERTVEPRRRPEGPYEQTVGEAELGRMNRQIADLHAQIDALKGRGDRGGEYERWRGVGGTRTRTGVRIDQLQERVHHEIGRAGREIEGYMDYP